VAKKPKAAKIKDKAVKFNDKHYAKKSFSMPTEQKCPVKGCKEKARKYSRTLGGAWYRCPKHGQFFVKAKEAKKEKVSNG
jgi:hypothetical protein